jgi:hypothetical protein
VVSSFSALLLKQEENVIPLSPAALLKQEECGSFNYFLATKAGRMWFLYILLHYSSRKKWLLYVLPCYSSRRNLPPVSPALLLK